MFFLICHVAEFNVWTREAGAGGLSIAVEGPSRAEISFEERKDGSCGVSYVAQEPGMYKHTQTNAFLSCAAFKVLYSSMWSNLRSCIPSFNADTQQMYLISKLFAGDYEVSIKFNDEHIPDSPFLVPVCAPVDDARRLTVTSLQVRHEETSTHRCMSAAIKVQLFTSQNNQRDSYNGKRWNSVQMLFIWQFLCNDTHTFP